MNIGVPVSFQISAFIFFGLIPKSGIARWYVSISISSFLRNLQMIWIINQSMGGSAKCLCDDPHNLFWNLCLHTRARLSLQHCYNETQKVQIPSFMTCLPWKLVCAFSVDLSFNSQLTSLACAEMSQGNELFAVNFLPLPGLCWTVSLPGLSYFHSVQGGGDTSKEKTIVCLQSIQFIEDGRAQYVGQLQCIDSYNTMWQGP